MQKLPAELRRDQIAAYVHEHATATADELGDRFGVSLMTVWRDLTTLEDAGRVRRVRGGAARLERRADAEPLYDSKRVLNSLAKERIARYTVEHFAKDGDILFMEAGTTVAAMVKYLSVYQHLTVIGNGLGTMNELARLSPNVSVYCCGGMLRPVAFTFVGPQAEQYFHDINASTCFLGATGLTLTEGITDVSLLEIQVKRAMAASADQVIFLMDSSKFGVRSLARIVPLNEVDVLVTDTDAPPPFVDALRNLGIDVHLA
ncbi:MAG: DeoR/GlpR transcriptional regulator [Caldilineaceae bacterium]|nr:DeoR/GlpR transcriptional regulator [Caldilineaceae bacterium]